MASSPDASVDASRAADAPPAGHDAAVAPDALVPSDSAIPLDAPPPDAGPPAPPVTRGSCGEGSPWVATHYVAATATGAGDGSPANPWTLEQAMARAVAGNRVQVAPGVYTARATGSRYTPAFNPANSGSAAAPIVFFAQYPAVFHRENRSELRNDAPAAETGSPTFGALDRSDIVWDGFYVNEARAHSRADTGPVVVWSSQRVRLCHNVIEAEPITRQDNHNAIRFEGSTDGAVLQNELFNVRATAGFGRNYAAIMSYDSARVRVENNHFHDNDVDVFVKGWHGDPAPPNASWTIRYNRMERARTVAIDLLGVNEPVGLARTVVSHNLIVGARAALLPHCFSARAPSDFDFANNTVVNPTESFALLVGTVGVNDVRIQRNLVVGGPLAYYFAEISGADLRAFKTRGLDIDDNHYAGQARAIASIGGAGGGAFTTVAALAASTEYGAPGTGFERNGSQGDPLFVNAAAGDYHLQAGSPARTAATGGGAVGCYATGTEVIGLP